MTRTFYSYSFGCRVNQAEKEIIDRQLLNFGFKIDENKPDFYIINTCCVTQKAEREAKNLIHRIKRRSPKAKIVITGCSATYWQKNNLLKNLPIDLLIDNVNKEFLVKIIKKQPFCQPCPNRGGWASGGVGDKYLNSGRAIIKIQDGCQRFCSYCIVPYLRGRPKSYLIKDIIKQINLFSPSIKEIILTAINTEAYGIDTGETLIQLIKTILTNSTISRISFGSVHPLSINNEFFEFYKQILPLNRLVNFFHIPIQSGSNKILSLMKRGYTKEEIIDKVQSINRLNSFAFITTDIIVGFLEETDRDFEDTYNFLKESPISKFHIFRFSKRLKTAAYYMAKNLKEPTASVKIKRAKALAELSEEKYEKFLQKNVGRTSSVLLLQRKINGFQEGLLDNQLPIYIKSTKAIQPARLYGAKIIEFKRGRLFGKII